MIKRQIEPFIEQGIAEFPAVCIVGSRQVGKSTLAKQLIQERQNSIYLDLENPRDLLKVQDLFGFCERFQDSLICFDEIQRLPEFFAPLRSIIDQRGRAGQFLLLGSASPKLLRQSSESLAGRITTFELFPISFEEGNGRYSLIQHILRGGFPKSLLAGSDGASWRWRRAFLRTYLERDLRGISAGCNPERMERFLSMLAHWNGQLWNQSIIAQSLGVSSPTVRSDLDLMIQTFFIRELKPFESNLKKRLTRSPKIFFRDSGVLTSILEIESEEDLFGHPAWGTIWEGVVIESVAQKLGDEGRISFYRTQVGAEMDLVIERGKRRICIECKTSSVPALSRGFWQSLEDLNPEKCFVVTPYEEEIQHKEGVIQMGLKGLMKRLFAE